VAAGILTARGATNAQAISRASVVNARALLKMHCRLAPSIPALTTLHCEPNRGNSIDLSKRPNATAASQHGDPGNSDVDLVQSGRSHLIH